MPRARCRVQSRPRENCDAPKSWQRRSARKGQSGALCYFLHQVMPFYADYCINQADYIEQTIGIGRTSPMTKTFLITGVSSVFGRALAGAALSDGHTVAGTVHNDVDKRKF